MRLPKQRRRSWTLIAVLCGSCLCLARCQSVEEAPKTDSWYAPIPEDYEISVLDLFPESLVPHWEVPHSSFQKAERELEDTDLVEIDREVAAARYGLGFVGLPEEGRLFLLRALYFVPPGTGGFDVHFLEGNVVVFHVSLVPASVTVHRTRSAVIALLADRPKRVFVMCSAAE